MSIGGVGVDFIITSYLLLLKNSKKSNVYTYYNNINDSILSNKNLLYRTKKEASRIVLLWAQVLPVAPPTRVTLNANLKEEA
jgi:hypothetical protein